MVMNPPVDSRSIRFPASRHIWVPRSGRRAAAAGISMHSPCRPIKVWAQRALYLGVRTIGPRIIPGPHASWAEVIDSQLWQQLEETWSSHVGRFDAASMYMRPQAGRAGFAVLLINRGRAVAFGRVHPDDARVRREFEVISAVNAARPQTFRVARPIAYGSVDSAAWMLTTSGPNYPLGAVRRSAVRSTVAREISEILSNTITPPPGTPSHWVPAHGDFSPWNLRTELSGTVRVIDWEDAGFAPPGVDELYGDLTAHTTFGSPLPSSTTAEAREWVHRLLNARAAQQPNTTTEQSQLQRALERVPTVD